MKTIKKYKKYIIVSLIFILGLTLLYCYILSNNNLIKVWDHSTYWITTLGQKYSVLQDSIITTIKNIYHSINNDDYNLLASTILLPIFIWTNGNYFSYGISIFIMGIIPVFLIYVLLFKKIYGKTKADWLALVLFLIPFAFSPSIHSPTMEGYLDVIGLIPIGIILYYTYNYNFEKFDLKRTIILSICFLLTIILRRYYVYFTVSYFLTLAIIYTVKKLWIKKEAQWFKQGLHLFIIGISFSLVTIILFRPMIERIIIGDYANSYSAYSLGNIFYQIKQITQHIGIGTFIIFVASCIYLLLKSKEKREFIIILITNMILSILLFNRVQTMDQHHYYIFLLNILLIISMFFVDLYLSYRKKGSKKKLAVLIIICLYSLLNLYFAINPFKNSALIFSKTKISYQSDFREMIKPTMQYLKELLEDNDDIVYTVASSGVYNNETFANYDLPETELRNRIIPTPNVDLRDGFSNSIYEAKYVLVVTPKQLHLDEKDQQVVSIIYDAIEEESPIKENYKLIKEFKFSETESIKIYEKCKDYDNEDKEYLKNEFNKSYKKYKELFENRIME